MTGDRRRVIAAGEPFGGRLADALGCTEGHERPTEFWVQTSSWGSPACAQHVADVLRRALREHRAVVVDRDPLGNRLCQQHWGEGTTR